MMTSCTKSILAKKGNRLGGSMKINDFMFIEKGKLNFHFDGFCDEDDFELTRNGEVISLEEDEVLGLDEGRYSFSYGCDDEFVFSFDFTVNSDRVRVFNCFIDPEKSYEWGGAVPFTGVTYFENE